MKGSKWTWLRDKCIELGYNESANSAQEIEDVLHRLYGTTDTKAWVDAKEDVIEEHFEREPRKIIENSRFCCACEETRGSSIGCCGYLFGKEVGACDADNSLYRKFCDIFLMEQSKK